MVEGLWTVQFQGPQGDGGGVVVFTNGKVLGGDSGFTYVGTYEGDPVLKARVAVRNFLPGVPNVLGVPGDFELHISCNVQGDAMTGTAMLAGQPQRSLAIRLTKKASFHSFRPSARGRSGAWPSPAELILLSRVARPSSAWAGFSWVDERAPDGKTPTSSAAAPSSFSPRAVEGSVVPHWLGVLFGTNTPAQAKLGLIG